eukprot:4645542-Pyramimonas_sp.AAC.1
MPQSYRNALTPPPSDTEVDDDVTVTEPRGAGSADEGLVDDGESQPNCRAERPCLRVQRASEVGAKLLGPLALDE